jgi:hypothetical protein
MDHPYCHDTSSFEGVQKDGVAPNRMTMDEIYIAISTRTTWLASRGGPQCNDPSRIPRVKRLSILFQLEYWKVIINIFINDHMVRFDNLDVNDYARIH